MSKTYGYLFAGMFTVVGMILVGFMLADKGERPVACTMDAKICPDGTAVGRTGPACEFAACPEAKNEKPGLIKVTSPEVNAVVSSPLELRGEARGYWYFEASFPIHIYDANNKLLGTAIGQAEGEWMTENFVPFKTQIIFEKPTTETGYVTFEKDNPSGLPENADELRIPVRFDLAQETRTIKLYYYNSEKDKDNQGNIMCTKAGLVPVERTISLTKTPVQDAVKLLLQGALSPIESAQGVTTEFPLEGVSLAGVSMKGDTLTLAFNDPMHKTTGGACRVGILWAQMEATAKQFPGVKEVKFSPEDLFQP